MSNIKSSKNVKNNVEYKFDIKDAFNKLENKNIVKSESNQKSKTVDEVGKKWNMNDKIVDLFKEKIENDNKLKSKYASWLIVILVIQLLALNILFILKGKNILNYSDTTFNIFITGGIAEVFLLVRVIVKYLFTDNLSGALKIILENNNKVISKNSNNKLNNKNKQEQ